MPTTLPLLGRRTRICALILLALSIALRPAAAQHANGSEAELEAAFIYNFAKFVEWPADAVSGGALTIVVIDDEALATVLKRVVDGKRAQGRSITVVAERGRASTDAQIAVVGSLDEALVAWHLERIGDRPVLTVGHSPRFLQAGGTIRFKTVENRLRFEINVSAAGRAGLRMSAQLLELAWSRSK